MKKPALLAVAPVAAIVIVCSPFDARSIAHAPDLAGLIHGAWFTVTSP